MKVLEEAVIAAQEFDEAAQADEESHHISYVLYLLLVNNLDMTHNSS